MRSKAGVKLHEFTVTLLKPGGTPISVTAHKSLSRYMRICSREASDQEILSSIRSLAPEQSFLLLIPFSAKRLESKSTIFTLASPRRGSKRSLTEKERKMLNEENP